MKRGFLLSSFTTGRKIRHNTLTIIFGLSTYNYNFGKTYNYIPMQICKKKSFLYKNI